MTGRCYSEYIRSQGIRLYVCPFDLEFLRALPWGHELFDAYLVALDSAEAGEQMGRAIAALVALNNDWIETFGVEAERLHDEIDAASVAIGRQSAVGDGSPMTAWHDDLTSISAVADYITIGGLGACDFKLVGIVGAGRVSSFIRELKERLPGAIGVLL